MCIIVQVAVENLVASEAMVVNVQQTGFYRVNYDDNNWSLIASRLATDPASVHRVNRAQLLDDAFNLARAGQLDYTIPLSLTEYLAHEDDYIPWSTTFRALGYINSMIYRSAGYGDYRAYLLKILEPLYQKLGFWQKREDGFMDGKLRGLMVGNLLLMGHREVTRTSMELVEEWMITSVNRVPAAFRYLLLQPHIGRIGQMGQMTTLQLQVKCLLYCGEGRGTHNLGLLLVSISQLQQR